MPLGEFGEGRAKPGEELSFPPRALRVLRTGRQERWPSSLPSCLPPSSVPAIKRLCAEQPPCPVPMHRLAFVLLHLGALANFGDPAAPSGSIRALRASNLRRDESNHLTALYRKEETISVWEHGSIHSPRFPQSYPRNLLLTWKLLSPENARIQLVFDPQFGLEEPENDICRYDFVEVQDISEISMLIRGRWCGYKEAPPRITSKTNQLKITFKSDDYLVAKPGFKIYYSLVYDLQDVSVANWESVTSPVMGVSHHSSSVTDPTLTAEALDQTIAEFDTVEELLRHFNPDTWQEDMKNLYTETAPPRGRSFYERKSKVDLDQLNDDVKRYSCTPRNYSVNIREELKQTSVVFFPRCLLVQRCGGNCGCSFTRWKSCTCTPGKVVKKYHEVLRFTPEASPTWWRRRTKNNMALIDIQLEHHERCDCICSARPPR
ncbi:platelet-derived growth factor D [Anolis carolinensis]|uniref:Platelet-derived growth factor D n=1 Tax=Anolis carolinensis TaxID=28377 RepID=G1KLM4_ANOCA|nr:PREDICTED: platelet-derived growth factor D [Anolis carolinensis]|eukprot:XP_008106250.1 PREDICTED: platelet-derived growth factor D [Anolis carolinensis]